MLSVLRRNYPLVFLFVTLALVVVVLLSGARRNYTEYLEHQRHMMRDAVTGAANQLGLVIDGLRTSTALFVHGHQGMLERLAADRDPQAERHVAEALRRYLRADGDFALADASGQTLYESGGRAFGEQCRDDLLRIARQGLADPLTRLHPGSSDYHFDILVPWERPSGEQGIFVASFPVDMLVRMLRDHQPMGHKLMLVRRDGQDLIEVTAEGSRARLQRPARLTSAELARTPFAKELPGTDWSIVTLPIPGLIEARRADIRDQLLLALAGFGALALAMLALLRREERRRGGAEQALRDSHAELERRVQERTRALMQANQSLQREIIERQRAEEAEMAHVLRLSTLGELASGLAHELKQPLSAIRASAEASQRQVHTAPEAVAQGLGDIVRQVGRAADIIQHLGQLVRKQPSEPQPVEVNAAVRDVMRLLQGEAVRHGVTTELSLAEPLPSVLASQVQIEQVILNLAYNAIEAMAENAGSERRLTVTTRCQGADTIEVAVCDTGTGLDPARQDELFQPFRSTKPDGMGMGLPISRSIVQSHGGRLWAEPAPGGGTCFRVELPALDQSARQAS